MEIRLTRHAERRMIAARLTREEVVAIIESPARTVIGETAAEYDGEVHGVLYRVIVARDSAPALVITAYRVEVGR